jgi:hypothetical protein
LLPFGKSIDLSLNKTKPNKKKSHNNFMKIKYLLKKGQKKNNDTLINKTGLCSGGTTALISCISTPGHKLRDTKTMLENSDY